MSLESGARIGSYEIVAPLGAGGMGEVYRATDTKLGRQVAIKVLPSALANDARKRLALYHFGGPSSSSPDILTAAVEGDASHPRLGKLELFVGTPFIELYPRFSPDGHWLAYSSNETGSFEAYVRPFPGPGGRRQISTGGGMFPVWSRNGSELFFLTQDLRIMAVNYTARGDTFTPGKPRVWTETRLPPVNTPTPIYDLAPDGKRFAVLTTSSDSGEQKALTHLTFLLNFFDELRRRVPSGGQ